jgi:D-serine deaminase-like pyridoxal phosphate-dependent protein
VPGLPFQHLELDGLETPAVLVDVDRLEANIAALAELVAGRGVALRPHAKTSKCPEVTARQLAAGAAGLSVATLGEAEVLARTGVADLFQAYPLWAGEPGRARRLADLGRRIRLRVGVASAEGAAALGRALDPGGGPLEVLVEVDCGQGRSGVAPAGTGAVARAARDAGLAVVGAFTFPGHAYAPGAPGRAAADEVAALTVAAAELARAGVADPVLSAGSTPTARISARAPVTETRPGVYVFNDRQQLALGSAGPGEVALAVAATVVDRGSGGRFVLDCGSKVLSSDRPDWLGGHGLLPALPGAELLALSEHHAVGRTGAGAAPPVGHVLAVVPNHCCPVVNLVDELVACRKGRPVARWTVAARGANT